MSRKHPYTSKLHNQRLKELLRQILDIFTREQHREHEEGRCLGCHQVECASGCPVEVVLRKAKEFGLTYDYDDTEGDGDAE